MKLSDIDEVRFLRIENACLQKEINWIWLHYSSQCCERCTEHLEELIMRNEEQLQHLQEALKSIGDEEVREMIELRIKGYSWEEICDRVYHYQSRQACRVRVQRAIEKL